MTKKALITGTRFDTSHSAVHRDLIAPDGTVTKRWFLNFNFDEGFTFAYNGIEKLVMDLINKVTNRVLR